MNTQQTSNINQLKDGCCCSGNSSTPNDTRNVKELLEPLHQLQVQGATCSGCVKSIEQALKSVSGVGEATMNLATGIASVVGVVDPDHLVEALQSSGFPAVVNRKLSSKTTGGKV